MHSVFLSLVRSCSLGWILIHSFPLDALKSQTRFIFIFPSFEGSEFTILVSVKVEATWAVCIRLHPASWTSQPPWIQPNPLSDPEITFILSSWRRRRNLVITYTWKEKGTKHVPLKLLLDLRKWNGTAV